MKLLRQALVSEIEDATSSGISGMSIQEDPREAEDDED